MIRRIDELDEMIILTIRENEGIMIKELFKCLRKQAIDNFAFSTLRYQLMTLEIEGSVIAERTRYTTRYRINSEASLMEP